MRLNRIRSREIHQKNLLTDLHDFLPIRFKKEIFSLQYQEKILSQNILFAVELRAKRKTKRFRGYILRISTDRPACGVPKLLGKKVSHINFM